jgi:putative ABC transport system substrate-binding protein
MQTNGARGCGSEWMPAIAMIASRASEIERVIASFAQEPDAGLVALPHALTVFNASVIVGLAQRYRMPDIHALSEVAAVGGLVSYGLNWDDQFRRAAEYVDRILKGAKPAELPVEQPTKFELVVNLKTAKAIGLDIPPTLLTRADRVIE